MERVRQLQEARDVVGVRCGGAPGSAPHTAFGLIDASHVGGHINMEHAMICRGQELAETAAH